MHIGFDQDGTITHWGGGWDLRRLTDYPTLTRIPLTQDQRSFNLKLGLNEEECAAVDAIFNYPGFYKDLEPIDGALDAIRLTIERGHSVEIVTSPWWANPTCLQDKSDWVARYLGEEFRAKIVFTSDKTGWRGDYLVDDKPEIKGRHAPEWSQILYDQPYNRDVSGLLRVTDWKTDWPNILDILEERHAWGSVHLVEC